MKAIRCREWGAPDVLRLEEAESPSEAPRRRRRSPNSSPAEVDLFREIPGAQHSETILFVGWALGACELCHPQ